VGELHFVAFEDERKDIKEQVKEYWTERADGFFELRHDEIESSKADRWKSEIGKALKKAGILTNEDIAVDKNEGKRLTVLDLGCGTGLELRYYFDIVPTAEITGIDLASGMLEALKEKFPGKTLTLIHGSYFDIPLEENAFDAVVSVESLHHFTKEEKIPLYEKVRKALKPGRYFILTDYFAASNEEEESRRTEFLRLRKEQGICDDAFYHFDTPLTVDHEKEALLIAGFSSVTILGAWGPTYTLKAER
jgi:tRNA (cmo5U34)-methyltransferase